MYSYCERSCSSHKKKHQKIVRNNIFQLPGFFFQHLILIYHMDPSPEYRTDRGSATQNYLAWLHIV
jgi:hypothetical protein